MKQSIFRPHNRKELPVKRREVELVKQDLTARDRAMIESFKKGGTDGSRHGR